MSETKLPTEGVQINVDLTAVKDSISELKTSITAVSEMVSEHVEGKDTGKGITESIPTDKLKEKKKAFEDARMAWIRDLSPARVTVSHETDFDSVEEAIGNADPDAAMPEIWSTDVEKTSLYPASVMLSGIVVNWKKDVKGKPGDIVNVPTVGPVVDAEISSGTEPTFTASTVSSVAVTLTQRGHGYYITKDDLEDALPTVLPALDEQSGRAIAKAVDAHFLNAIQADDGNAAAGTIDEAGNMAGTCLAKMWGSLMAGTYAGPYDVFMHPIPYASLLQDSQFTNAATWGDSTVIRTAKIPTYLGMTIYPLIQGTLKAATGGTYRTFVCARGALIGALKRGLTLEKQYLVKDQRQYVVQSIRFGGTAVHLNGIGLITSVDT